jgi:hypothetical protein
MDEELIVFLIIGLFILGSMGNEGKKIKRYCKIRFRNMDDGIRRSRIYSERYSHIR